MANLNHGGADELPVFHGSFELRDDSFRTFADWQLTQAPDVVVVGLRGIPDISGGIETHCEYLLPKIADKNPDKNYIVIGRRPYMGRDVLKRRSNLSVVPLAALSNRFLETISNTAVGICVARFRYRARIVHLHAVGPALLAPLARLLGAKVVFTHHGDDYKRAKWNRAVQWILKSGERIGMSASNHVIAVSASLADRLRAEYPRKAHAIHYIPNGADHILSDTAHRTRKVDDWLADHGLLGKDYIVSVGRMVPEKGFVDLIRAYAIARPAAKLVIVGGKSGSDHDKEIVDLIHAEGLTEDVILTGAIAREGVAALLSKAALFVLASHHEGLPIAALEASAMGAPILLSDIQPNLDLGLPARHYVPVANPPALAKALAEGGAALGDTDLIARFNWARIAADTDAVYTAAAQG